MTEVDTVALTASGNAAREAFEADLVRDLLSVRDRRETTRPPTLRREDFSLDDAYRVGAALDRRLRDRGYRPAGCKIGFTNKTIWPRFGLDEPILAPVYDRTLRRATPKVEVSLGRFRAPRIEVEVVFGVDLRAGAREPGRPIWVALGFEIVDCHYAGWRLTPADSVADFGLHGAIVVGPRVERDSPDFDERVACLDELEVRLFRNETPVAGGRGDAVLGHPLEALKVVPKLLPRFDPGERSQAEAVVSTGTMTALEPLSPGERWRAVAAGVDLPGLEMTLTG